MAKVHVLACLNSEQMNDCLTFRNFEFQIFKKYSKSLKGKRTMKRKNCWEFQQCGWKPYSENLNKIGVCPAVLPSIYDGINNGNYAGRACWLVKGTFCKGGIQGAYAQKIKDCLQCEFLKQVHEEEGRYFKLSTPKKR